MGQTRITAAEKAAKYNAEQERLRVKQQATMQAWQQDEAIRERHRRAGRREVMKKAGAIILSLLIIALILLYTAKRG